MNRSTNIPSYAACFLPCSLCFCQGLFVHWQDMVSMDPGGSTDLPAARYSDSSHKARGNVCTTGPQPEDTLGRDKGALSLGPSLRSPWGSASIVLPTWGQKCSCLKSSLDKLWFPLTFASSSYCLQVHTDVQQHTSS